MENLIFKAIVGSQASGCNTPESDIDHKGVYVQHIDELITFNYKPQIEVTKDETYWEIQRFLQLAQLANPSVLELMFSPGDCIILNSPQWDLIVENRHKFLTKKCLQTFGGYVKSQLQKASGLDKKMNYEKERITKKSVLDFTFVYMDGKTLNIQDWLILKGFKQENCGLVNLDHFKDCYGLYHSEINNYNGLLVGDSNQYKLSSIPKGEKAECIIFYNKDEYSKHCKDFKEYNMWLNNRNTNRYVDVENHQQKIDGKNLLHCRRLLDIAIEIARDGELNIRRPNREELLNIKKGKVNLEEIIEKANKDLEILPELYKKSNLPDDCDMNFVNELLLKIRKL